MEAVMNAKMNIQEEKAITPTRRVFNLGSIRVRLLIIFVLLALLLAALVVVSAWPSRGQGGDDGACHEGGTEPSPATTRIPATEEGE